LEYCWTDRFGTHGIGQALSFARFRVQGLGCGEFPIPVWLGARGTGMKFTDLPDRCTTSSTGHS
jgi:hypothetical protein